MDPNRDDYGGRRIPLGDPEGQLGDSFSPAGTVAGLPSALLEGLQQVLTAACSSLQLPAGLLLREEAGHLLPILHVGLEDQVVPSGPVALEAGQVPGSLLASLRAALPEWSARPLEYRGRRAGWLLLGGREPMPQPEGRQREWATFAGLATLLLVAHEESLRQEERQRAVAEESRVRATVEHISTLLSSCMDREEIWQVTVQEMAQAFQVDHCGVLLLDEEKRYAQAVAEYPGQELVGRQWPLADIPAALEVIRTGEPLALADVREAMPGAESCSQVQRMDLRSMLLLPLAVAGDVLGTIQLGTLGTPRVFSPTEIAAARAVACQVAAAAVRARLFQEKAASEQRLSQLIGQSHELIWIADPEGRILFASPEAGRALGYEAGSWVGKELWPLLVPEDVPRSRELLQETLAGREQRHEARVYDSAGSVHHLEIETAPLSSGGEVVGMVGFARDISERRESEQALLQRTHQAEKRAALLRAIGEVSRQVLTLLNPISLLQSAVDSLVQNLGYDFAHVLLLEEDALVVRASSGKSGRAEVGFGFPLGRGITGLVATTGQPHMSSDVEQDAHYYAYAELASTRSELAVPIRNTTEVCGVLDVQSTARGAFDDADLLALTSLADQLGVALENAQLLDSLHERMAELELARARLSQAEKLSALGELIANAAHELNNPLTSVIGYAQLLQSSLQEPEALQDLGTIIQAAQRAARIVEDLLIFARQRVPAVEPADVNDLIRQTVRVRFPSLAQEDIQVELELAPDVLPVRADSAQLEQVLINLILNARQAIIEGPGQGHIGLRTSLFEEGASAGRWVRIEVIDDGPGIPEEILLRIFDPFFTTREGLGATGMGLSICYGIIVRHGGLIWAESVPGKGAHFFVELPVWEEDSESTP